MKKTTVTHLSADNNNFNDLFAKLDLEEMSDMLSVTHSQTFSSSANMPQTSDKRHEKQDEVLETELEMIDKRYLSISSISEKVMTAAFSLNSSNRDKDF